MRKPGFQKWPMWDSANARYLSERLNAIPGILVMKPTPGADEIGCYVYPFLFDPEFFKEAA